MKKGSLVRLRKMNMKKDHTMYLWTMSRKDDEQRSVIEIGSLELLMYCGVYKSTKDFSKIYRNITAKNIIEMTEWITNLNKWYKNASFQVFIRLSTGQIVFESTGGLEINDILIEEV